MVTPRSLALILVVFVACAWLACASGEETGAAATGPTSSATGGEAAGGDGGGVSQGGSGASQRLPAQSCPAGQYAVDVDDDGMLACSAFDGDVVAAVEASCQLHLGWRDGCSGCSAAPSKAGRVSGLSCDNLAGADNTCTEPTLGMDTLALFGLNTDGDVDGNDMFYAGWYCPAVGETPHAGPCDSGEHAVAASLDRVECLSDDRLVAEYVRTHCSLYFGWRDGCSSCPDPPSKWGRQQGTDCQVTGSDSVCGAPFVGAQWVTMAGINTDGDVDDNDRFFVGLHCTQGSADETSAPERCPFGTLLIGVSDDGSLRCASPSPDIAPTIIDSCRLVFGYRDGCNGCTDPPVKWGSTGTNDCQATQSSSCAEHMLDSVAVNLLSIVSDGDVDGNDKLYVGLTCQ